MPTTEPPLLFGIDPDETWDYIPEAIRGKAQKTVFVLKSPSLAVAMKRDTFLSEIAKAADAAVPEIEGEREDLPALPDTASDDQKAERSERIKLRAGIMRRWLLAWEQAVKDRADEEQAITERYIREGVAGWRDLPSRSGGVIDYEANKGRILEVLRGQIVTELCNAIAKGAEVSPEEKVGLPSTQESQSA